MAVTTVSVYGKPLSEPRAKIKTRVHSRRRIITVSHLFSVAALVFAAIGLPQLSTLKASTFGLLFAGVGGYLIAAAVLCGVAAFMIALFQRRLVSGWIALFVTMAVFRLPTIFASYLPMYGWTYKHIGVVDYIQTHGNVATNVDIYFAWPGLFAAVAWFCDLTGLSPTTLALFFIPAIHIAQALAVYALARALRSPKVVALTAAFVAEILNWIGQDYFSPQAIGFVMATATLALLFSSRRNIAYAWLSILPFFALAITHQLTPYWVCLVVFFGCALKLIRPRYMFLIYGGIALLWMILHSYALGRYGLFNGINILSNAERPSYGVMIAGRHLTETMMKGVAAFTWLSAASIIAVRFFRRGKKRVRLTRVWLPLIITFSSFILLGGQNYGGEAIFRVLLYSLPGASIIIAGGLVWLTTWVAKHNWRNLLHVLVAFPLALLIGAASLQAQYGTFFPNVIDRSAYTAFSSIMKDYPAGSYTLAFSPAGPGRMSGDYVEWATKNPMYDASLMDFNDMYFLRKTFKNKTEENQVTELAQSLGKPVVLTWTKEMSRQADYYGLYPDGAFSNLIGWLEKDDRWRVVLKKSDIIVFELKGSVK